MGILRGIVCLAFVGVCTFLGGPCGLGFALVLVVIEETSRARSRENDRVIRAIRGQREPSSGPSWVTIIVALLGLAALLGYARMKAKGYSSPSELLQEIAPATSR